MLVVRVRIAYTLHLSPECESDPELHFWLTQHLSKDVISKRVTMHNTSPTRGELRLDLPFALLPDARTNNRWRTLLCQSALNVEAFAYMNNAHRERCLGPAGARTVWFADLFAPRTDEAAHVFTTTLDIPACMENAVEANKGELTFSRIACALFYTPNTTYAAGFTRLKPVYLAQWSEPTLPRVPFGAFTQQVQAMFERGTLPATWKSVQNINAFVWVSQVGILPVNAFVDAPTAGTPCAYFEHVCRLALAERALDEGAFLALDLARPADAKRAACVLATAMSMYIRYCNYIVDEVCVRNADGAFYMKLIEWFYWMRVRRGALDCEDAALELACILAQELLQCEMPTPLVARMQAIRRAYVSTMLLDGVSNTEINLDSDAPDADADADGGNSNSNSKSNSNSNSSRCRRGASARPPPDHMGAHMNAALVPWWLQKRWSAYPPLCATHGPSDAELAFSEPFPFISLEGTGVLEPDCDVREDAVAQAIGNALDRRVGRALGGRWRKRYFYSADAQSPFYKTCQLALSNELLHRGCSTCVWAMCAPHESSGGGGAVGAVGDEFAPRCTYTMGVAFEDLVHDAEEQWKRAYRDDDDERVPRQAPVALHPEPGMSSEAAGVCRAYCANLHPLPALLPPSAEEAACALVRRADEQIAVLQERVEKEIASRARFSAPLRSAEARRAVVERFLKFEHAQNEHELVRPIVDALQQMEASIVVLDVIKQHVTGCIGGYRVLFTFDAPRVCANS